VQYAVLHPQLCGQGGNEVLADILRESAKESDTYIVSGACAPEAQAKLFRKLLRKTGFDPKRFVPVDIRSTNNDGILAVIREKVATLIREQESAAAGGNVDFTLTCLSSDSWRIAAPCRATLHFPISTGAPLAILPALVNLKSS